MLEDGTCPIQSYSLGPFPNNHTGTPCRSNHVFAPMTIWFRSFVHTTRIRNPDLFNMLNKHVAKPITNSTSIAFAVNSEISYLCFGASTGLTCFPVPPVPSFYIAREGFDWWCGFVGGKREANPETTNPKHLFGAFRGSLAALQSPAFFQNLLAIGIRMWHRS